jgi:hypothetical protein
MKRTAIVVLLVLLSANLQVAMASVRPHVRDLVDESQWIIVGRVVSTEDTRPPSQYQVVAQIIHILKGDGLPRMKSEPTCISFVHFATPWGEGPDFRQECPPGDCIFFLRLHPTTSEFCLTSDWYGVQAITPELTNDLSDAGVEVWPLVAPSVLGLLIGGITTVLAVGVCAALLALVIVRARVSAERRGRGEKHAEQSLAAESR